MQPLFHHQPQYQHLMEKYWKTLINFSFESRNMLKQLTIGTTSVYSMATHNFFGTLPWNGTVNYEPQLGVHKRGWGSKCSFSINSIYQIHRARQEQQWKNCKQEENEIIKEFIISLRALWQEQKPNETENDLIRHLMCKMKNNLLTMVGISRLGMYRD